MFRSTLFLILASLLSLSFLSADKVRTDPKDPVIAVYDGKTQKFKLNRSVLQDKFVKGGKITEFEVIKEKGIFYLIRRGYDAKKSARTEAIQLKAVKFKKPKIKLHLDFEVKWYTVCTSINCDSGFCRKVGSDKCECAGGEDCKFGIDPIQPMDILVII